MIYITFKLANPWSKRWDSMFGHGASISEHKAIEIQLMKTADIVFFQVEFKTKTDHAGLYLEVGFLGFNAAFQVYDTRHWDYENDNWMKYIP